MGIRNVKLPAWKIRYKLWSDQQGSSEDIWFHRIRGLPMNKGFSNSSSYLANLEVPSTVDLLKHI